jgi:Tol biopolymer transport system component
VPNDGDSTRDVFLYDRVNRTMERIGAAPVTFEVDAEPSISYDGLFVAFVSGSALVKEDGNESLDVYVYDRKNKILALSSFTFEGTLANHDSWESSISPDGQYIAFRSYATNLVADDNNGVSDIFATPNPLGF